MKKKILTAVLASLFSLSSLGQINLPDLSGPSAAVLPPAQEREIGQDIMRQIRNGEVPIAYYDDPEVTDYIQQLGNRLVRSSDMARGYPIEFFLVDDMSINAMAFLGGFIGIHTGLIVAAQTESELASVMAHEIAHVSQRHIAQSIMRQEQTQPLQALALLFAIAIATNSPGAAGGLMTGAIAGSTQLFLNYSRDFERDADRMGFQTLERAGFNVADYASMFERMHQSNRMLDSGFLPAYLRTHPMTWERIADIQNLVGNAKPEPVVDSVGFHLVRVKLQVLRMTPKDGVVEYDKQLTEKRYLKAYAAHYGAALANSRAKNYAAAQQHLDWLKENRIEHPMVSLLSARVLAQQEKVDESMAAYQAALKRYPSDFAVIYETATMMLAAGRTQGVIDLLLPKVQPDVSDARLYRILAQAYQRLNQPAQYHTALAEAYARNGNYHDAITQIELAQKSPGASFYEQSIQDARLREFQKRFKEMKDR